jgi:hypothetical protein
MMGYTQMARPEEKKRAPSFISPAMALAATFLIGLAVGRTRAQSAPTQAPAVQAPTPQWQIDAGGKMEFDVASVKPNKGGLPPSGPRPYSNIPLGPQDMYSPTGGLLTATNMPLFQYMIFAYKLSPDQVKSVLNQLPKWTTSENFDIQARATGNPTKDQFRLMMQALLADRFKMAVHFETRQLPVYGLVLDKTGKLGPKISSIPRMRRVPPQCPRPGRLKVCLRPWLAVFQRVVERLWEGLSPGESAWARGI